MFSTPKAGLQFLWEPASPCGGFIVRQTGEDEVISGSLEKSAGQLRKKAEGSAISPDRVSTGNRDLVCIWLFKGVTRVSDSYSELSNHDWALPKCG